MKLWTHGRHRRRHWTIRWCFRYLVGHHWQGMTSGQRWQLVAFAEAWMVLGTGKENGRNMVLRLEMTRSGSCDLSCSSQLKSLSESLVFLGGNICIMLSNMYRSWINRFFCLCLCSTGSGHHLLRFLWAMWRLKVCYIIIFQWIPGACRHWHLGENTWKNKHQVFLRIPKFSHVSGSSKEHPFPKSQYVTLPETNIVHENPHLSW